MTPISVTKIQFHWPFLAIFVKLKVSSSKIDTVLLKNAGLIFVLSLAVLLNYFFCGRIEETIYNIQWVGVGFSVLPFYDMFCISFI